ncbi:hypothetical protein RPHASCH2410_PD03700 (plasmid) [Rhizobium phaseoli Ch24-10]|nr:hypothetical protein RPHASCH2410_PD03700 [Rhizobium phaseoli Ch24-10]
MIYDQSRSRRCPSIARDASSRPAWGQESVSLQSRCPDRALGEGCGNTVGGAIWSDKEVEIAVDIGVAIGLQGTHRHAIRNSQSFRGAALSAAYSLGLCVGARLCRCLRAADRPVAGRSRVSCPSRDAASPRRSGGITSHDGLWADRGRNGAARSLCAAYERHLRRADPGRQCPHHFRLQSSLHVCRHRPCLCR